MKLTIGADPEFFLRREGKPVSAYGLIKGTKKEPTPVERGAVQVDGMALEFNINPAHDVEEFTMNINTVLSELRKMIPPDYDFSFTSAEKFDAAYMETQPKEAVELGCDPDFNAWTGAENPPPDAKKLMRTAAGHIHLGFGEFNPQDDDHFESCCKLIKQLDATLGLSSVLHDNGHERRKLYGKAGAFRPKPYGVEYRVLSNYWLRNRQDMERVFFDTHRAFKALVDGHDYSEELKDYDIPGIINSGDQNVAIRALQRINWL